ncbi:hypothetical protein M2271_007229 [Streptomyces sp. LBL]|nr:hypothetical protein [Streptomyces sp. LBL]
MSTPTPSAEEKPFDCLTDWTAIASVRGWP